MDIGNVRRSSQFGRWAEMVQACRNSGQSVRTWCEDNGINIKTYYYRLRKLRLIALGSKERSEGILPVKTETYPAFAELTLCESRLPETASEEACALAVTIKAGVMTIYIHNEAGAAVITNVIRAVNEIS